MPKVAYSEQDRAQIRQALVAKALELMACQGIQHTTVEQIYRAVGISRTFFYSFFPTKEDLIVETLYLQQPRIIAYAQSLMADPALCWKDAVQTFLRTCCYGEQNGIAVLTIEEQQLLFRRLPKKSYRIFREKQAQLFGNILKCFGIQPDTERVQLFTNLCLAHSGHPPRHSGNTASACPGGCGQNGLFPDQRSGRLSGVSAAA